MPVATILRSQLTRAMSIVQSQLTLVMSIVKSQLTLAATIVKSLHTRAAATTSNRRHLLKCIMPRPATNTAHLPITEGRNSRLSPAIAMVKKSPMTTPMGRSSGHHLV